jgi:hypothetical protein
MLAPIQRNHSGPFFVVNALDVNFVILPWPPWERIEKHVSGLNRAEFDGHDSALHLAPTNDAKA